MAENIEQIALRVAEETDAYCEAMQQRAVDDGGAINGDYQEFRDKEFARRLVAELTKGQEPVAWRWKSEEPFTEGRWRLSEMPLTPYGNRIIQALYAAPIPSTCPTCTQAIDDAAKAGRIVDDRDDYKARALLYERTNAEQAAMLNAVIAERDGLMEACADDIRTEGWTVAVHNDYRLATTPHTFWLFTKDGVAVKGEGCTDAFALNQVRAAIAKAQP